MPDPTPPLPGMPDPPDRLTRRTGLRADERHALGDHRSCQPAAYGWAAQWRELTLEAATAALERAPGRRFAILCLRCDDPPALLATVSRRWDATGLRVSRNGRRPLQT
jgi:hypothetical protein